MAKKKTETSVEPVGKVDVEAVEEVVEEPVYEDQPAPESEPAPVEENLEALVGNSTDDNEMMEEPLEGMEETVPDAEDERGCESVALTEDEMDADPDTSPDENTKELRDILENPVIREVDPKIRKALEDETMSQLELSASLYRASQAIVEKSFRRYVKDHLEMDEKRAYYFRAVGEVVFTLITKNGLSKDQVVNIPISKYAILSRFEKESWRVEDGAILLTNGDSQELLSEMSVDDLRKLLQETKAKEAATPMEDLKEALAKIEENGALRFEIEKQMEPLKTVYRPLVKQWLLEVENKAERGVKSIEAARASLKALCEAMQGIESEKRKAQWWLNLIEGGDAEFRPENAATQADAHQQAANADRAAVAAAVAKGAKKRAKSLASAA